MTAKRRERVLFAKRKKWGKNVKERIFTLTLSSFLDHCKQTTKVRRMELTPLKRSFDEDYDPHNFFLNPWKNVLVMKEKQSAEQH